MIQETINRIQPGEFYKILPDGRWEIYLDATMCGTFGVCEAMFYESFVRCIVPKGDRPFARDLGSWWSAVMEEIYGAMFKESRLDSKAIVDMSMVKWNELQMDELEKVHPKAYKEFGGRYGALQMIAEYATRQLPIDYQIWKIVAAEASFGRNKEVCIGETDKIILYWMGQPDLFVISGERLSPIDHKSIAYIDASTSKKYKPHIQIPGYIVAGQILAKSLGYDLPVDRAVINCVARTDRTDKSGESKYPRFKRISVSYTPTELDEWRQRRLAQAERLRFCFENNTWAWNEYACSNVWNKPCQFQNIHEKPPEVRPIVIAADYMKRAAWIPGKTEKEEEKKAE
jgi:PD-(D/E)XK nuclease superfamily protein